MKSSISPQKGNLSYRNPYINNVKVLNTADHVKFISVTISSDLLE